MAQLAAHKRFPPSLRGQTGEVTVQFELDRSGNLISKKVAKSSDVPQFDAAALDMVESSQPFPPAPPEVNDFKFSLPVYFQAGRKLSGDDIGKHEDIMREETKVGAKMRGICRGC